MTGQKGERKEPTDFDVRVVRRNLEKGTIDRTDLERHLEELPDAAHNVAEPPPEPAKGDA